jgi:hypothetical protein
MGKESDRLINIAKGCLGYTGGYAGDKEKLMIYRKGIQRVIKALKDSAEPNSTSDILEKLGKSI